MRPQSLRAVADGPAMQDAVASGAATPRIKIFDWQSYLDTTLLQDAILAQNIAPARIVGSTFKNEQLSGIGFALSPSSECPVTVAPNQSKGGSSASGVVLKPGQVYYPGGEFRSFAWGLPYGWLGGGLAQLYILRERSSELFWTNDPEVLFHRMTLPIYDPTSNPASLSPNWPLRFPWPNAVNLNAVNQGDQPTMVVQPTKTILRPRVASLAQQVTLRLLFSQTQDFDYTGGAAPSTVAGSVAGSFLDTDWPAFPASGFQVGGVTQKEWPTQTFSDAELRIGGDLAQLSVIDLYNLTTGAYIDVLRYGRVGG